MQFYSPVVPATVTVRFATRRCTGSPTAVSSVPLYYSKTITLAATGVFPGTDGVPFTKHISDTAVALFAITGGSPTNQTALDALALQIATDYYSWLTNMEVTVYNGVVTPDFDGTIDAITWMYSSRDCLTNVQSLGFNADPEEMQHFDQAENACSDSNNSFNPTSKTPWVEYYAPSLMCGGDVSTATATLTADAVTAVSVITPGSFYTSAPTVLFSEGDGHGAAATATVSGGAITGVTVTSGGSGYTTPPIVSFLGGVSAGGSPQAVRRKMSIIDGRITSYFVSVDTV